MVGLIVITQPHFMEDEARVLNTLFERGLRRLHLRKPNADESEVARLIEDIDEPYRQRVVVHYYHSLAKKYSLGGVHLSAVCPVPPEDWRGSVSRSCHTLDELAQDAGLYDYSFLSPIYDSISKKGYKANFSDETLTKARECGIVNERVVALGGVEPEKMRELRSWGFGGAAVLGGLWQGEEPSAIYERFDNFMRAAKVFI